MAADEFLLDHAESPVLRLYAWSEPTISLGYAQRFEGTGLPVVRRPSGGRALLHDDEITYAVVLPEVTSSVAEAFTRITGWLAEALRRCGVPVEISAFSRKSGRSASCLALTQAGELQLEGVKLVGSAQVRRGARLLQHGSIPLRVDRERAERLLPGHPPIQGVLERGYTLKAPQLAAAFPHRLREVPWSREDILTIFQHARLR